MIFCSLISVLFVLLVSRANVSVSPGCDGGGDDHVLWGFSWILMVDGLAG